MKRYTGNYIVRWTDKQGKSQRKSYKDYGTAQKARKYLTDNGVGDADIAVELEVKSE